VAKRIISKRIPLTPTLSRKERGVKKADEIGKMTIQ
jgi:hypothetical protein